MLRGMLPFTATTQPMEKRFTSKLFTSSYRIVSVFGELPSAVVSLVCAEGKAS
jgi:hypothetical protein